MKDKRISERVSGGDPFFLSAIVFFALPLVVVVDLYYRLRYGVWLHTAVSGALNEVDAHD